MSDVDIANAVRKYAPTELHRMDFIYAGVCQYSQTWHTLEWVDGRAIAWDPPYDLKFELARVRMWERSESQGCWISVQVRIDGSSVSIDRNWNRRIYFGDHAGAPFAPPASGEVDPTDEMWRNEFVLRKRSPENIPDWLPPRTEPVVVMDYERPLSGAAAQFANDPATAVWIPRVQALVQDGAEGWIGMREGLRDEAGGLDEFRASGIVDATFDLLEEQVWDAEGDEAEAGKRVLDNIGPIVMSILEAQYIGH